MAADLGKFFERIGHQRLIDEAVAVRYPLRLLRMNLMAYRGLTRCRLEAAYGRPIRARRTVGPGCSHAKR